MGDSATRVYTRRTSRYASKFRNVEVIEKQFNH
jgi:hypothetical protein